MIGDIDSMCIDFICGSVIGSLLTTAVSIAIFKCVRRQYLEDVVKDVIAKHSKEG